VRFSEDLTTVPSPERHVILPITTKRLVGAQWFSLSPPPLSSYFCFPPEEMAGNIFENEDSIFGSVEGARLAGQNIPKSIDEIG